MRKLRTEEIERLTTSEAKRSVKHPIVGVIEDVRSIHNVGSIFRTAEAAGIERLYLTGITGTPENRMLRKSALGAEEVVPWQHALQIEDVIGDLKSSGYTVAALELTDTPGVISELTNSAFPLALIVGNEVSGVSDPTLKLCDLSLEIRQYGSKHSLNVAVAFGIATFRLVEHFRQIA